MARLLRLHLANVGHPDARFAPLTLDFRASDGIAANTVLWLRNGGGKSSLLNLFYSTFIPQKTRFLGKKADGRSRELPDYVQGRDLACVVSEWDMASTPGQASETRVIGQIMAWKDAAASPHDESRLDRHFFTFRTNSTVTFESLPIHGLREQPVLSLTQFKDWLNWLKTEHRSLEAETRTQKSDWVRVLGEIGFDEDLFRYQLVMNGREGGADELFRVRSADEFIELFLEMAYSPQHANQTAKTLGGVREKLRKLPQHVLEERFALELIAALRPLDGAAEELENAAKAWDDQRRQNFLLHSAISHSLELLKTHLLVAREGERSIDGQLSELKRSRESLGEYRRNYEVMAFELAFTEAESELKQADETYRAAERHYQIGVAAVALTALRGQEARLAGFRATREKLRIEQKPELEALKSAGSTFSHSLMSAKEEAVVLFNAVEEQLGVAKIQRKQMETRLTELTKKVTVADTEFAQLNKQLTLRDQRRGILRNDGLIEPQEKAEAAALRLDAKLKSKEQEADVLEAASAAAERLATECREAADTTALTQKTLEDKAKELTVGVERGEAELSALRENVCIREVLSTDAPDLEFEPLAELLRKREAECLRRIISTELDVADDKRADRAIESDHLLPASRDVEVALEYLRSQQVLTAMPAYQFLSQNERQTVRAEERLRADPARFSGIMVNTETDLERVRSRLNSAPGLRHPVAVTLTGLPEEAVAVPKTVVLMPESAGAFNQAAAAAAKDDIRLRLKHATDVIRQLNEVRLGTAEVHKRLLTFRDEFGRGALARMIMERNLAREEASITRTKVELLLEESKTHHAESVGQRDMAKAIRKELPAIATGARRVHDYFQEFERYGDEWMMKRGELQDLIRSLNNEYDQLAREKDELINQLDTLQDNLVSRRSIVEALASELSAIEHGNDGPCTDLKPVEEARSLYTTLRMAFEQRYGGQKIDGQIDEAETVRVTMEAEYKRKRQNLGNDEVERFAAEGDVFERMKAADNARVESGARSNAAKHSLEKARNERKPRAHKQGEGLPMGTVKPTTAAEARAKQAEMNDRIDQLDSDREDIQALLNRQREECGRLETSLASRAPLLTVLEDHVTESSGALPAIAEDDLELKAHVETAKRTAERLSRTHSDASKRVDDLHAKLIAITRREEFQSLPTTAREKLQVLPKAELLARCHELKSGYEEHQKVLRNEIETYSADRDLVVRELHNVARNAHNLLGQAERASTMPETMLGWAGQPFLRIRTAEIPEQTACRERLGLLVDRLVQEKAIPDGHKLALAAVREIAGPFRVTVLKPEPVLNPHRHDIVDFSSFSGGERLTAAILLYTALAQLRARSREGAVRAREAGLLILDNPFGAASLREFVDLQQRVAKQMGVQLIYATGVNDLGALEVFPRILRLRNAHVDRYTGNKLVTAEAVSPGVRVAAANLRQ